MPALNLWDRRAEGRLTITVGLDGTPAIRMYKLDGTTWSAP
jgi:hypothetical protein